MTPPRVGHRQVLEPVDVADRREPEAPDHGDPHRRDAADARPPAPRPSSAAATPDSNAPSSFEARMNTDSSALTRPRSSGGVRSGASVPRISTLTMSAPASTASATSDSGKWSRGRTRSSRRRTVPTAPNRMRPTRRRSGQRGQRDADQDRADARRRAQQAVAAAPTCSTSVANTGRSAVAPPNSTAARSSEMAPSSAGVARTKRMPAVTSRHVGGRAARRDDVRRADRGAAARRGTPRCDGRGDRRRCRAPDR